jgi:hypothetical protein
MTTTMTTIDDVDDYENAFQSKEKKLRGTKYFTKTKGEARK